MISRDIITKLLDYKVQLIHVLGQAAQANHRMDLASEYSFITIHYQESAQPVTVIRFKIDDKAGTLYDIYNDDGPTLEHIKNKVVDSQWPGWHSSAGTSHPYSEEIDSLLGIADQVAALSSRCAAGDDYTPGNFSKVFVNDEYIELEQVNHMHSRSLDHKDNYSLRTLVFTLPLEPKQPVKKFGTYEIGKMTVEFKDHSSANNKMCGDRIWEALERHIKSA